VSARDESVCRSKEKEKKPVADRDEAEAREMRTMMRALSLLIVNIFCKYR